MSDNSCIWSGHVAIWEQDGKKLIRYCKDGEKIGAVYVPDGFFEGKCIKGLIEKLQK